jgi:hypothetical protein
MFVWNSRRKNITYARRTISSVHPYAEQMPNKKDVNFYTISQIQGGSSQQPRAAHKGGGGVNRYFERHLHITPKNNYNLHKPDALYSQIKNFLHQHKA